MSESEPTSGGRRVPGITAGRALALGVVGLTGAHLVALAAVGSLAGQQFHDPRLGAAVVAVGAFVAAVALPVGLGIAGVRQLTARGAKIRSGPVLLTWLGAYAVAGLALVAWLAPSPTLLVERSTFVIDGLRGEGPFGHAAVPAVERRLAEAAAASDLRAAAPLLSSESAAGEALQRILALDATRDRRPDDSAGARALDRLIGRWELDLDAARSAPEQLTTTDGRKLLDDVLALPDADADGAWAWPRPLPSEPVIEVRSRRVLALGDGWEARYEDGAWRLHAKDLRSYLEKAAPKAEVVVEDPTLDPALDPEVVAAVREALGAAARGRYGWMAGTTGYVAQWPDALSGESAVLQGERVRAYCAGSAGDDALFAHDHARLFDRFSLGEPSPALSNAQVAALSSRGRAWLTEVLAICRPVVAASQKAAEEAGNPVPDRRRMRWALRDADELVAAARISAGPSPELLRITLPGGDGLPGDTPEIVRGAVLQNGAWRIDWGD